MVDDTILHTNMVTDHLSKALAFPGNVEFIGYKEQFRGEFSEGLLTDCVHLDNDTKMTLSAASS